MTERRKKQLAIAGIVIFLLFSLAVCWFVGRPLLRFVSEPERFREWVDSHGLFGRVAFVGMMTLQIVIAFIPGEPLEIGAGYAFGVWEGTLLCLIGALIGSALVFGFVRTCGVRAVEVFFSREKIESLRFLRDERRRNLLTFIVFLIPGTPKDVLSYCVGLTGMRLRTWLLITGIARIPSVITSTVGGDALGMGNHVFAVLVFVLTLIISAIGLLIYRGICRRENRKADEDSDGTEKK